MRYKREIGEHTGLPFVTLGIEGGRELDSHHCAACLGTNIHVCIIREPNVDFLTPIIGAPYPTYKSEWILTTDCFCRDCGAKWGQTDFTGECSPDDLPFSLSTKLRIDHELGETLTNPGKFNPPTPTPAPPTRRLEL